MSERRHRVLRARLTIALTLVGASVLFAGCGDGAHLPASMAASSSSGGDALNSVLGTDPGSQLATQSSTVDDPVLGDYSGIDEVDALGDGDMWANAQSDMYDDGASALTTASLDEPLLDDPYGDDGYGYGYGRNVGYGYGDGWGSTLGLGGLYNSYGYGNGIVGGVGMAAYGGVGALDAGIDPTIADTTFDPTFDDLGGSIDDPSVGIGAADMSIDDGLGGFDFGSPIDFTGGADLSGGADFSGPVDFGGDFSGGADIAPVDVGGFDGGAVDVSPIDMGGMDVGGAVDVGGGMDIGGMDAGFGF